MGNGERDSRSERRVLIFCQLDRYANGLRPVEIARFLRQCGHDVRLVNTYFLGRASSAADSLANKLPGMTPMRTLVYGVEAASAVTRRSGVGRRNLSYYVLLGDYYLRRRILASLPLDDFDLIICETPHDAGVLTVATSARTLYDCPTPWADELYFEGRLSERQHRRFRQLENSLFERVDHVSFWWESYARHVVDHYGASPRNIVKLNFGCNPSPQRATFATPPRIVYLGSLSSRFIDLPLLSRLTKLYPCLDVYGGPPPDPALGLNYCGYASPTILRNYQLGLITCTKDELRRNGFSAKHLEYLAYGLPVLVPVWRRYLELLRGSVAYDEQTFADVVGSLSSAGNWHSASDDAYAQAQQLKWSTTLRPLEALVEGSPSPR